MADLKNYQIKASEDNLSKNPSGDHSRMTRPMKGNQKTTCLVDGCKSNMSNCKDYHRRHRVCEFHSKSPVVFVRGEQKRFCQQCSRFHNLGEFDEVKRSCRKRLDGHNRRRRKPPPESIYMSSKDFLSNFKGPRILRFSDPEMHITDHTGRIMCPTMAKSESQATTHSSLQWMQLNDQQTFPKKIPPLSNNEGYKQFSSQQETDPKDRANQTPSQVSLCQPLPLTLTSPESEWSGHKMRPDHHKVSVPEPLDSGCALYLLSKQESEFQYNSVLGYSCLYGIKDPASRISIFDYNKTNVQGGTTVQMEEPDGLFGSEVSTELPMSWE